MANEPATKCNEQQNNGVQIRQSKRLTNEYFDIARRAVNKKKKNEEEKQAFYV